MEYNFRIYTIQWQMSKSTNVSPTFLRQFIQFQNVKIFNVWPSNNRSRSRGTIFAITSFGGKCQNLQISLTRVCVSSYRFTDKNFHCFYLQKVGQGHGEDKCSFGLRPQMFICILLHFLAKYENERMSHI